MQLLLNVWREVCRQVELAESISRLAVLVRREIPADIVGVRRLVPDETLVETVALGSSGEMPLPRQARTVCGEGDVDRAMAWARRGQILEGSTRDAGSLFRLLAPLDMRGHGLVGPLLTRSGIVGILLLTSKLSDAFTDEHRTLMQTLLDPFTVALENQYRFHELQRLREAAEAEKSALLSRLNRQEIVEEIIGVEGTLRLVMERVEQVAVTGVPVLILGETGTGKEVIARAIHSHSPRRDGPIVRVNCGAIPSELVDSELFGHEKGSFTGAVSQRKGWFERANGGTLFLDEIAELPLAAQVRLLRVLQDGTFERVGGQSTLTSDVRIIAATHRDMDRLVAEGRFRDDLWYRISIFPIYLPPLRARQDDLPELARHFARNAGLRMGGITLAPSEEDLRFLRAYPWPGNVRELSAVIERAVILGGGHRLDIRGAMGTKVYATAPQGSNDAPDALERPLATLDEAMAAHIVRALERTKGQVDGPDGAASLLRINPNTLRGRMRRLGVDWRTVRKR